MQPWFMRPLTITLPIDRTYYTKEIQKQYKRRKEIKKKINAR